MGELKFNIKLAFRAEFHYIRASPLSNLETCHVPGPV